MSSCRALARTTAFKVWRRRQTIRDRWQCGAALPRTRDFRCSCTQLLSHRWRVSSIELVGTDAVLETRTPSAFPLPDTAPHLLHLRGLPFNAGPDDVGLWIHEATGGGVGRGTTFVHKVAGPIDTGEAFVALHTEEEQEALLEACTPVDGTCKMREASACLVTRDLVVSETCLSW